jgi:hypothetical protein
MSGRAARPDVPFETPDLLGPSAPVPERVETEAFTIRPLTVDDARMDYEAVTASRQRLTGTFGPDHDWPPADLTLDQNRIDVAWHHKEFQRRDAFTYAVVDPAGRVELGCVYVQPTRAQGYDAAVYFWVSEAGVDRGLAGAIESEVRGWLADEWPFEAVAYPGRDIPWTEWTPDSPG